jgi:hypothetical protein
MDDLDVDPAAIALPRKKGVVYKVVLTGGIIFYVPRIAALLLYAGPCAGKTTSLSRLRIFFEGLGWKVYTVPEIPTLLFE